MDLDECFKRLRNGYCLWVGAGVSIQLARSGGGRVPNWNELAEQLERAASTTCPAGVSLSLPERLEVAQRLLGRVTFQKTLRENTLSAIAKSIEAAATQRAPLKDASIIPDELRQLVKLGHAANPIVNFNVEHLTTTALAAVGGFALKVFVPRVVGGIDGRPDKHCSLPQGGSFVRHVYHPHGAIDHGGICVITAGEYASMDGTLALELAVHAAFRCDLLIVGMSLEDDYLREQIAKFRPFIDGIYWVKPGTLEPDDATWAYKNDVSVVQPASFGSFWEYVGGLEGPAELNMASIVAGRRQGGDKRPPPFALHRVQHARFRDARRRGRDDQAVRS